MEVIYVITYLKQRPFQKTKQVNFQLTFHSYIEFIISCVLLGINDLNIKKIIHRDIKPENIILDSNGYAYITDFGIAMKEGDKLLSKEICGTLGYMAPEALQIGKPLTFAVDYFSVGVLLHELLFGEVPHQGESLKEVKEFFESEELKVNEDYAQEVTESCVRFMNELFVTKHKQRLGYKGGVCEIQKHAWFDEFDWLSVASKQFESPFVPSFSNDNFNSALIDEHYMKQIKQINNNSKHETTNPLARLYKKFTFINTNSNDKGDCGSYEVSKVNTKINKFRLRKQLSSSTVGNEELSSSRANGFSPVNASDQNDLPLLLNEKKCMNLNDVDYKSKNDLSLPKLFSPHSYSSLHSIQEERTSPHSKKEQNHLSYSKFFNYKVEDHLQSEMEDIVSPFKYSANQIQMNRNKHSLNKHKTIRIKKNFIHNGNGSEKEHKVNGDVERSLKKSMSNVDMFRSNNKRKSFFDFALNIS